MWKFLIIFTILYTTSHGNDSKGDNIDLYDDDDDSPDYPDIIEGRANFPDYDDHIVNLDQNLAKQIIGMAKKKDRKFLAKLYEDEKIGRNGLKNSKNEREKRSWMEMNYKGIKKSTNVDKKNKRDNKGVKDNKIGKDNKPTKSKYVKNGPRRRNLPYHSPPILKFESFVAADKNESNERSFSDDTDFHFEKAVELLSNDLRLLPKQLSEKELVVALIDAFTNHGIKGKILQNIESRLWRIYILKMADKCKSDMNEWSNILTKVFQILEQR